MSDTIIITKADAANFFRTWSAAISDLASPLEDRERAWLDCAEATGRKVRTKEIGRTFAADELTALAGDRSLPQALFPDHDVDKIQAVIADKFKPNGNPASPPAMNGHNPSDEPAVIRLQSKSEFIGGYVAPDWLIDGILQRRYVYSLTARTGDGKTAVAQLITKLVSMPNCGSTFLGRHAVDHGNTIYFAGENPDDLRMRIIADDAKDGRKGATDNCSFIVGTFEIPAMFAECKAKAAAMPGAKIDLVIVDTSAAYFLGEEENSNAQMGNYARTLRTLTELPGQPCVLVLCHPVKNAADQTQLLPRGGGAFIAEMDGNLTLWRTDEVTELWHTGKLRGPGFEPMTFRLEKITCDFLVDKKGRHIPTVRAVAISESDKDDLARTTRSNEDRLLAAMLEPGRSVEALASACGWTSSGGEAQKSKAHRILKSLEKSGLVRLHRGTYELTDKGKPAAAAAARAAAA